MCNRRGMTGVLLAVTVAFSATLFAQGTQKRKLDDTQKNEIQVGQKIVDAAIAGQAQPNDLSMAWAHQDVLKAESGREFVPFVVTIDPSKVTTGNVVIYWRVKAAGGAAPTKKSENRSPANRGWALRRGSNRPAAYATFAPAQDAPMGGTSDFGSPQLKPEVKKDANIWEDVSSKILVPKQSEPLQIARSFAAAPGDYDVYIVVKELTSKDKKAAPPKVSYLKQTITIPDLWNGELTTSSVMVADKVEQLTAPLTPLQLIDRPYASLGTMEITPSITNKFSKSQELTVFVFVYNPKPDSGGKTPDVQVEFNFYAKSGGAEKFFNKTNPQALNAQTLPPQFDLNAGHQLPGSIQVPLASFPAGDYRLEIKVTDKLADKTLTREVNFTVGA